MICLMLSNLFIALKKHTTHTHKLHFTKLIIYNLMADFEEDLMAFWMFKSNKIKQNRIHKSERNYKLFWTCRFYSSNKKIKVVSCSSFLCFPPVFGTHIHLQLAANGGAGEKRIGGEQKKKFIQRFLTRGEKK